jgi:hypothetical protein
MKRLVAWSAVLGAIALVAVFLVSVRIDQVEQQRHLEALDHASAECKSRAFAHVARLKNNYPLTKAEETRVFYDDIMECAQ